MLLDESKSCICSICEAVIASKTKLFKHLEDVHGMTNPNAKPCKCVLLVGWLATARHDQVQLPDHARMTSGITYLNKWSTFNDS